MAKAQRTVRELEPRWKWFISLCLLIHLGCIGLTLSTNRRRSAVQDQMHILLQPYMIGFNWYHEMLPMDWSDGTPTNMVTVSYQTMNSNDWTPFLPSRLGPSGLLGLGHDKSIRLVRLMSELGESDNDEGMLQIMRSIAIHLDVSIPTSDRVRRIRLSRNQETDADTNTPLEQVNEKNLFEVAIARFENGEIGLIPKIEEHREVRAKVSRGNAP